MLMRQQIYAYFEDNIISIYQCGCRVVLSTGHRLLLMIEKWNLFLDQGNQFGASLTDLSKALDSVSQC